MTETNSKGNPLLISEMVPLFHQSIMRITRQILRFLRIGLYIVQFFFWTIVVIATKPMRYAHPGRIFLPKSPSIGGLHHDFLIC